MRHTVVLGAFVGACVLGWSVAPGWGDTAEASALLLKEEKLTLEYTATSHEAAIVIEAESEEGMGATVLALLKKCQ